MEYQCKLELVRTKDDQTRTEKFGVPTTLSSSIPEDGKTTENLGSRPSTVADLKTNIRKKLNIPECLQELSFEGETLSDDTVLKETSIRDDDTIRVKYIWEGDCEAIIHAVSWLKKTEHLLDIQATQFEIDSRIDRTLVEDLNSHLLDDEGSLIENLLEKYFDPQTNSRSHVNKLHFIAIDGLNILMNSYQHAMVLPWKRMTYFVRNYANESLLVLWSLCEIHEIEKFILSNNKCFQHFLDCLMLKKMEDITGINYGIFANCLLYEDQRINTTFKTMMGALGLLCNLSEVPECHMEIATHPGLVEQVSRIYSTPHIDHLHVRLSASLFFRLAYTPEVHPLLTTPAVLKRLLDCILSEMWIGEEEYMITRFFTQVFLAQLVLVSPNLIPDELKMSVHTCMRNFFIKQMHDQLQYRDREQQSIFIPLVKLLYIQPPTQSPSEEDPIEESLEYKMYLVSLWSALFALQILLNQERHRKLLFQEKLEDYIFCAQFYVPKTLKGLTRELVKIVASPKAPSLENMVRAKLAATRYGNLLPVLEKSVSEIAIDMMK